MLNQTWALDFMTETLYDKDGQVTGTYTQVDPITHQPEISATSYDKDGHLIGTSDADGNSTQTWYNAAGQVTAD